MIDDLLDENGRGTMTEEIRQMFLANGCEPECHICDKVLPPTADFRLKPFARERKDPRKKDQNLQTAAVMVCARCDERIKPLPYPQMAKIAELLGLEDYAGNLHFDEASENFLGKYEILFPFESLEAYEKRDARNRSRRTAGVGGCFMLSDGVSATIIPNTP